MSERDTRHRASEDTNTTVKTLNHEDDEDDEERRLAPPSQGRRLAALALLLVPPPWSATLDLGGDSGETVAWRACGVATGPGVSPGPIVVALSFDEYSSAREAPQTPSVLAFGNLAVAVMGA